MKLKISTLEVEMTNGRDSASCLPNAVNGYVTDTCEAFKAIIRRRCGVASSCERDLSAELGDFATGSGT